MIFSVLVSVASLGFGVYKNIEAGNARGFAYEQAYRVLNVVNSAQIGSAAKANILSAALGSLGAPQPVIDLSRSSADVAAQTQSCSGALQNNCIVLAEQLAGLNATCVRDKKTGDACIRAERIKSDIKAMGCVSCF